MFKDVNRCLDDILKYNNIRKILEIGLPFNNISESLIKTSSNFELYLNINPINSEDKINDGNLRFYKAECNSAKSKSENVKYWYQVPDILRLLENNDFDVIFVHIGKDNIDVILNDFWHFLKCGKFIIFSDFYLDQEMPTITKEDIENLPSINLNGVFDYFEIKNENKKFLFIQKGNKTYPVKKSPEFFSFDRQIAQKINIKRLDHLASLGLDLYKKKVLEVGSGIGFLTKFFEKLNCNILSTEAREENYLEHRIRYPYRNVEFADLSQIDSHEKFGRFDVIFCYGTLYHLKDPSLCIKILSEICDKYFLLETCVNSIDNDDINLVLENTSDFTQSFTGLGCRPARDWILKELKKYFPYVYITKTQPDYTDFCTKWPNKNTKLANTRAIFVASREPLNLADLSEEIVNIQTRISDI